MPHGYVSHVLKILDMDILCVFGSGTIHYCLHYFLVCTTFFLIAKDFVYSHKVHSLEEDWEGLGFRVDCLEMCLHSYSTSGHVP
mgnify:FL=1